MIKHPKLFGARSQHADDHGYSRLHKSRICVQLKRSHVVAKMFRITLSAALALAAAAALLATNAQAQNGLRFNPGGFTPSVPYSTSTSILDVMPAAPTEAAQRDEPVNAVPEPSAASSTEAAPGNQQTPAASATSTETAIHQGLAPEKANPAAGLGAPRGASASPSSAPTGIPPDAQSPYSAPNPYTTPRSPGGGLKIR